MSFLIIGGLLFIAVIAIVALVFVIRSDDSSQAQPSTPPTVQSMPNTAPIQPVVITPHATSTPVPPPAARERVTTTLHENPADKPAPLSNGQLHELSYQLRTLHQQAQEIERRLQSLTTMIEHIDGSQNHFAGTDKEDTLNSTDLSSAH